MAIALAAAAIVASVVSGAQASLLASGSALAAPATTASAFRASARLTTCPAKPVVAKTRPRSQKGPLQIVFAAERDWDFDVYQAALAGHRVSALTVNNVDDRGGILSPGGRRFAVARAGALVIGDISARRARGVGRGLPAAWSPDGETLAFVDTGTYGLSVAPHDGQRRQLTRSGGAHDVGWSPDGSRLVYSDDYGSVFVLGATTATARKSLRFLDECGFASVLWSPAVELGLLCDGDRTQLLKVYDAAGQPLRRIALKSFDAFDGFAWSPSGSRLAFFGDGKVLLVDRCGRQTRRLAEANEIGSVAWSPNGGTLAFVARRRSGLEVDLVTPLGVERRLAASAALSVTPVWSPDGRWIAFVRGNELAVVPASGGRARVIARGRSIHLLGWRRGPLLRAAPPLRRVPAPAAAAKAMVQTEARISEIAANGNRIAALVARGPRICEHAAVWTVPTRRVVMVGIADCRKNPDFSAFWHDLTFNGRFVRWGQFWCGNNAYDEDMTVDLTKSRLAKGSGDPYGLGSCRDAKSPEHPKARPETRRGIEMTPHGNKIDLRRTGDGRVRTIRAPAGGIADANLTDAGLFYAYNTPTTRRYAYRGHIAFVPLNQLFS